ncbi:MAG: hypothetical protein ABTQ73_01575 [Caldilineales bacterium]
MPPVSADPENRRSLFAHRVVFACAILLYLALALPQLGAPGLHYDEAKEAGVNAMQLLQGQPVQVFRDSGVRIGSVLLPLMVQDYIGALNVYLALPLLALFGVTVPALRLLGLLAGLATLLLTRQLGCDLGRRLRGSSDAGWSGEIAALFLAVSPTFVFWSRQGIFVTNVTATLAVAAVLLALRWQRSRSLRLLLLLAAVAGLGLWSKLLFLWVLGALSGAAALAWLLRERSARGLRGPVRGWHLAAALLVFAVALSPLLLFNLQSAGTLRSVLGNAGQSYYGVQNSAFTINFLTRLAQLGTLLRGDHLWYLGESTANRWSPLLAAGMLVTALLFGAALPAVRRVLWPAALFVLLLVVQSSFTVSDLFITHFAVMQPFVLLLAALAADSLLWRGARAALPRWRTVLVLPVLLALLLWIGADARNSVRYHRVLARSGGLASHSDAIERLAGWLDQRAVQQPLMLDWGIEAQVRYLTLNRVQPLEIFGYARLDAPDADFAERAAQFIRDTSRLYVVRMPEQAVFQGRSDALQQLAAEYAMKLVIRDAIYDRSGTVMYVLLATEPVGSP